jgi:methyl-accepting chemotaxis protein
MMAPPDVIAGMPSRFAGRRFGWLWLLAGLASCCAAVPLLIQPDGWSLASWSGVSAIVLLGAWWASRADRSGRTDDVDVADATGEITKPSPHHEQLTRLLHQVLPVWLEHVSTVKTQTEQAITQLVISFSSITGQFEAAGFKGANGVTEDEHATFSLLTLCERQLHPVISTMSKILDSKASLVACVHELAAATTELQQMASSVTQIAAHTNLLAINAAIEAARAGESGRGFAVIAQEIRRLSQDSAGTGRQITDRMAQVSKIMKTTMDTANQADAHDRTAIELSGSVVRDVLSHVRELAANAEAMRGQGNVIRGDIENLLLNLQFQDRVSQISSAVENDMARLNQVIATAELLPPPEQWMQGLQTLYTTNEQRDMHDRGATAHAAPAAPKSDTVDFF